MGSKKIPEKKNVSEKSTKSQTDSGKGFIANSGPKRFMDEISGKKSPEHKRLKLPN